MTFRFAVLSTLCFLAGCQCLVPVSEDGGALENDGGAADGGAHRDAGADAGNTLDAGRDGGSECQTHADCQTPSPLPFCGEARSMCVNGSCLIACGAADAGRTCTHQAGDACLSCEGQPQACANCMPFRCRFDPQPLVGTCPPPFDDFQAFFVEPFGGRCGAAITRDGGHQGVWYGALREGGLIEIPGLGGTCIASPLATQIPRTVVSCPTCTFMAEGCE